MSGEREPSVKDTVDRILSQGLRQGDYEVGQVDRINFLRVGDSEFVMRIVDVNDEFESRVLTFDPPLDQFIEPSGERSGNSRGVEG